MQNAVILVASYLLVYPVSGLVVWNRTQDKPENSESTKPQAGQSQPKVVKDLVADGHGFKGEKLLRITGKVKVLDAGTLAFEDGTKVFVAGSIDTPELEQKGLIGGKFYPWGKEAAEFLRKLIGDKTVTFYAFGDSEGQGGKKINGLCFVGDVNLGVEMVRNGWALGRHSSMIPYEIIARENKRGIWRGEFVGPDQWRKGERLSGE